MAQEEDVPLEELRKIVENAAPMPFPEPYFTPDETDYSAELIFKYDLDQRPVNIDWNDHDVFPKSAPVPAKGAGPTKITNTTSYPYSSIVHIYMLYGSSAAGCSGAFIHNTHTILTAGHCIYHKELGGYPDDIIVIPGQNGGNYPFGNKYAYNWATNSSWMNYEDYTKDWGVIFVQPFGGNTGYMDTIWNSSYDFYYNNEFDTAGYPGDTPYSGEDMWWARDDVIGVNYAMLQMNYDFGGDPYPCIHGQSGSSIYLNQGGGNYATTAVLTLASCHGVRVSQNIVDTIETYDCGGCLIDNKCWDNNEENPNNVCQVCNTSKSTNSWTDNNGRACNDDKYCNGIDTCGGGSCSKHKGDPCPADKVCDEKLHCVDPDQLDDDDGDPDDVSCSDLLELLYNTCDLSIRSGGENLSGDQAYDMCKEDDGPWDCIRECSVHDDVDNCSDFVLCLTQLCEVSTSGGGSGGDDDDSGGNNCGG